MKRNTSDRDKLAFMLQNLWNPFRDWNRDADLAKLVGALGYKTSETLLGIETKIENVIGSYSKELQNLWNPFRDWNKREYS